MEGSPIGLTVEAYDDPDKLNCSWSVASQQSTVPQLLIMIIYNSTWSILIQWIMVILSGDNPT